MSRPVPSQALAVTRLRAALDELADALSAGSLDRLLACEARIDAALGAFALPEPGPNHDPAVRADIESARTALVRCRRLGQSLEAFITAGLAARRSQAGYDPRAGHGADDLHAFSLRV